MKEEWLHCMVTVLHDHNVISLSYATLPRRQGICIGGRIHQQEESKKKEGLLYQCKGFGSSCIILSSVPLHPTALSSTKMSENKHSELDLLQCCFISPYY